MTWKKGKEEGEKDRKASKAKQRKKPKPFLGEVNKRSEREREKIRKGKKLEFVLIYTAFHRPNKAYTCTK